MKDAAAIGAAYKQTQQAAHPNCFACSGGNEHGMQIAFSLSREGGVEATWFPRLKFQGYPGILQGGVTATLLDAAMTNCLFALGVAAGLRRSACVTGSR